MWGHLLGRHGCCPPPPIKGAPPPSHNTLIPFNSHMPFGWHLLPLLIPSLSHMLFGWHLPPLASLSSFTSTVLRRSPAQDLLYHHHHYVVVLLEFPRIYYFRCPTGARDGGRYQVCTCDRLRKCCLLQRSSSRS